MSALDGEIEHEAWPSFSSDFETSRFTYRDLQNLGRASTTTPLRVIALIDFDAFYAQCETVRLGLPKDQPLAVQQWKAIIALNYPAKAAGLKRGMSIEAVKLQCPEVVLQHVATWREGSPSWAYRADVNQHLTTDKAALDPYRIQSRKAFDLIKSKLPPPPVQKVEKASIDEVFCDLSVQVYNILLERYPELGGQSRDIQDVDARLPLPLTSLLDWENDKVVNASYMIHEAVQPDWDDIALNIGSEIIRCVREEIYDHMQYTCSAGVARNKPLAKLAAGHNKPNQQTVVRARAIQEFLSGYEFTKLRGLGGKLGQQIVTAFNTNKITDLLRFSHQDLSAKLGSESAQWVYNVVRGDDYAEVVERTALQSMLSAKTFVPRLTGFEQAEKWLRIFAGDLMGRLHEEDAVSASRRPRTIAFHHHIDGRFGPTRSKQTAIPSTAEINADLLFSLSKGLLAQLCEEGPSWPCLGLSVSVSDFENIEAGNRQLTSFFTRREQSLSLQAENTKTTADTSRKRDLSDFGGSQPLKSPSKDGLVSPTTIRPKKLKTLISELAYSSGDSTRLPDIDVELYNCPKCNSRISSEEVLEHLDWHVAMELQQTSE